ncbi:copper-binding protein [Paracidovorax konjaci]|uniref:Cu and Ag efflux protein CusF n=1 Tax=Paracidovorax konjaci TaxID=32040 RepID=A0A1I1WQA0_9BURK|nr:copper-binding protein [Paracidovorax konjaci]SFD95603.1 Cu and Ag efflux protein CusF [Paracidovorax konjaci]
MSTARSPKALRQALHALAAAALLATGLAQAMPAAGAAAASASVSPDPAAHASHAAHAAPPAPAPEAADRPMSEGEVVRWDAATRRITLRHGELKNLDMPPMTMMFRVQDGPASAADLAPGMRVRFLAERDPGGFFTASRIEPVGR